MTKTNLPFEYEIEYLSFGGRYTSAKHPPTGIEISAAGLIYRNQTELREILKNKVIYQILEQMLPKLQTYTSSQLMENDRVRIRTGWDGVGTEGVYITRIECGQSWAVVLWDGDEDPSVVKLSSLEFKKYIWTPCVSTTESITQPKNGGGAPKRS